MYHRRGLVGVCRRRQGAVILIVVLCLAVLLMVTGLTVDLGIMWTVSQRAQDAADSAALAAAAGLPDAAVARTQAQDIIAAVNEGQTRQFTVSEGDFTFYAAGDAIPGYGQLEAGAEAVEVRCHALVPYLFLRITGRESQDLCCRALARRAATDAQLPFIFAHDSVTTDTGITINGSGMTVNGDIHSNTRITINGSNQTVNGTVEWRNRLRVNGSGCHIADDVEGQILDYPVDLTYEQFLAQCTQTLSSIKLNGSGLTAPTGAIHVTGNVTFNGSGLYAQDCLYVVDGSITINGSGCQLVNCTFVAQGDITANGSSIALSTPKIDDTLFFSTGGDITTNGSGSTDSGLIYAPNGSITYNGSSQCLRDGSLLAETITVNGSGFTANGTTWTADGGYRVTLIR